MIVRAKVIAHAFDSKNAIQYWPNDVVELDLSNAHQRKLVWLKTPRGRWIFEFDRANSSDPDINMLFCKVCGEPFEKLHQLGTHTTQFHNKTKAAQEAAQADTDAETEATLRANLPKTNDEIKAEMIAAINARQQQGA